MDTNLAQSLAFNKHQEKFLEMVEQEFPVTIANKGNSFQVIGQKEFVRQASALLEEILRLTKKDPAITPQEVADYLGIANQVVEIKQQEISAEDDADIILFTSRNKPVKPKTEGQRRYISAIKKNDINK